MGWVLGLMSGTSLDGIDLALIETDGERVTGFGAAATEPYEAGFRERLRGILGARDDRAGVVTAVERELTDLHAAAALRFLADAKVAPADVALIGFHGHTILHRPEERRTWQIGDGARLAASLGIDVVNDFRSHDVAEGGQGAPLVPVYHAALAQSGGLTLPVAVLNIGGVANVTYIGRDGGLLAFDTGPGNALVDDWVRSHTGALFDADGAAAAAGWANGLALDHLLAHDYFAAPPPKSLDRDDFSPAIVEGLTYEDGAATLTAFTAHAVLRALDHMPEAPRRWLVTGGGRRNHTLMDILQTLLTVPVEPVEVMGWRGDALEAEAFAFLAARSVRGLPLSYPGTTGVPRPLSGGRLHTAK